MSSRHRSGRPVEAQSEDADLRRDHRHELGMLWRGLLAALIVVVVVWLRQHYLV